MDVYEDIYAQPHYLGEEISRGGQGVVYRTRDPDIALKLELNGTEPVMDPSGNRKYQMLRILPVPSGLHITMPRAPLKDAAGYIMTLLADMVSFDKAFQETPKQMPENQWIEATFSGPGMEPAKENYLRYFATGGARRRLEAYRQAAVIVSKLHENGLVYCDFNPQNLFISLPSDDGRRPEVWLIDADNLNFRQALQGAYTPGYCAPEACSGQFSFASDCYAFAVMLFEQLTQIHPFKGIQYQDCDIDWSEGSVDDLVDEGKFPWIWDENGENTAQELVAADMFVPSALRKLFERTFSEGGKRAPKTRPSMAEWAEELSRALDQTAGCPVCGMNFYAGEKKPCPWCDAEFPFLEVECFAWDPCGNQKGARIWRLCREVEENREFPVPARAAGGFVSDGEDAFVVYVTRNTVRLTQFSQQFRFELLDRGSFVPVFGTVDRRRGTAVLRAADVQDEFRVVIEVRVE